MYIAHVKENGEVQSVKEHLNRVAELSREYAIDEMKDTCYVAGLLHDAGKYLDDFQKRINGESSVHVEHSIVGAHILNERFADTPEALLIKAIIAGHHGGIPDLGLPIDTADDVTLKGRLKRKVSDYSAFYADYDISKINFNSDKFNFLLCSDCKTKDDLIEKFAFLTRYAFSCLTDADSIDSIEFVTGEQQECLHADFTSCLKKINDKFSQFMPKTDLQKARGEIQRQVYKKVCSNENFFLLNMPTGSGKTLCSTKFALQRAIQYEKKRIIYVIPYNSIIDQTYDELRKLFGDSAEILRHQSTYSYSDIDGLDEDYRSRSLSACENWDAQIIVTTSVQFFDSVYDNKRKRLRKLHNIADSVIIFDEIHLMPVDKMQPCLRAIEYVASILHSDIVFCTATMPNFRGLFEKYTSLNMPLSDLVEDKTEYDLFRKCTYSSIGVLSNDTLIEKARHYPSSLVVVNTRRKAQELYHLAVGRKYHLSTYMTPLDRLRVIDLIKSELAQLESDYPNLENVPEERKIIVISTPLIEAGVDLDFYCCFREFAGLDNILQTGGRCNREGKNTNSDVFVFETEDASREPSQDIRSEIVKGIINKYADFSCSDAIDEYYDKLFQLKEERISSHSVVQNMPQKDFRRIPFASYDFKMIDSRQMSIFVPQDARSQEIYKRIQEKRPINIRFIQKYSCMVTETDFNNLLSLGVIHNYDSEVYCLDNDRYYNSETGIITECIDVFFE